MPSKSDNPLLSPRFALALQFANQIHSTQVRKPKQNLPGAPYISHLMAVSGLVLEYGGNETQAIAALLHDAAEDCGGQPMLDTVRVMFGDKVADIVEACTDSLAASPTKKEAWQPRKTRYLKRMARKPPEAKLVACSDKLHNLSHTLRDIEIEGVQPWRKRMAKTENSTAEKQCWYYLGCLKALSTGWQNPALVSFGYAVIRLCELVDTPAEIAKARKLLGH